MIMLVWPGASRINLHDFAHVCGVGSVLCADPAQPLATAVEELDDVDHYLSILSWHCVIAHLMWGCWLT